MTTYSDRRSPPWSVRRGSRRAFALGIAVLLGSATIAEAAPAPFRDGQLSIYILDFDPLSIPLSAPLASGVLGATRVGDSLRAVGLPAGVFETSDLSVVIDPPFEDVVNGVQLVDVSHASAGFTETGGGGGFFGGPMPLQGTMRICAFNLTGPGCPGASLIVPVPLSVVGAPGTYTEDLLVASVTVEGAAWTTGSVAIPSSGEDIIVSGGISPVAGPGSDLAVEMVAPIYIQTTGLPGFEVVPAWATMQFVVPEPGTMALGGGAVGTLLLVGFTRRRRSVRRSPARSAPPANEASR